MNYSSTVTVESKDFPGVSYTLNRMSAGRRATFNLAMADYFAKQRDLLVEREPLETELLQIINEERATKRAERVREGAPIPDDDPFAELSADSSVSTRLEIRKQSPTITARFDESKVRQINDLTDKWLLLDQDQMQPKLVEWGLASITGLNIDEKPATVEGLIAKGPPELFTEIATEVSRVMGLSGIEAQNLELPITSGAQVTGQTNNSTAPLVSAMAST